MFTSFNYKIILNDSLFRLQLFKERNLLPLYIIINSLNFHFELFILNCFQNKNRLLIDKVKTMIAIFYLLPFLPNFSDIFNKH